MPSNSLCSMSAFVYNTGLFLSNIIITNMLVINRVFSAVIIVIKRTIFHTLIDRKIKVSWKQKSYSAGDFAGNGKPCG